MSELKFPFTRIGKGYLGIIYRPYARVEISSRNVDEWFPAEAVIDTGADYTLLPRRYADLLGIDVNVECHPDTTLGVGGSETIYLCKNKVRMRLGTWEQVIPAGFLERDDVPLLLGRLKVLEDFRVVFDKKVVHFYRR